ncbi:MAG: hypothetical protein JOZ07_16810 [Solirubrobacterales bacterium]|nr:hypothetical protein [Solirubrobacterales bacterium]
MPEPAELLAPLLIGLGGGLRSFAPPATLASRGRGPLPGAARFIAYGAAIGELIADKQPDMGSRWARRGLALRLGFSASAGHEAAGWPGLAVASSAALTSAYVGSRLRAVMSGGPGAPLAAAAEDALSYGLVLAGARRG